MGEFLFFRFWETGAVTVKREEKLSERRRGDGDDTTKFFSPSPFFLPLSLSLSLDPLSLRFSSSIIFTQRHHTRARMQGGRAWQRSCWS